DCVATGILSFRPQGEIFKLSDYNVSRFLTFARNDHLRNDGTASMQQCSPAQKGFPVFITKFL
ncbi:MAG TPA: hypothetical protein PKY80_08685, partial [Syntrophales bacterium]|nr:hypothetical protein [Syntrophales bacterium]